MSEPYQRIVSLVCIACETCKCESCNVEDLAKRIIDNIKADTIDEFVSRVITHCHMVGNCDFDDLMAIAKQLKEE